MLALSGPAGMVGSAHRAWAEQADIATVASVYVEQNDKVSNPQAEETGSLDPPQQIAANEGDVAPDNVPNASVKDASNEASDSDEAPAKMDDVRSATVTLDSSEDGWAYLTVEGAQEGDTLVLSVMGRADAIWTALLLEAFPEADIVDLGDNQVEIHLAMTDESGTWELPGVMADLVATAALLDSAGEMVAFAEGPALYSTNLTSAAGETFTAYNEHIVDGNCPKIRNAQTGQAAWCADSRRAAPGTSTETGEWPEATFSQASPWDATTVSGVNLGSILPQLEYIMAHADGTTDEGVYVAQYAVWTLTNPDRFAYGSYSHYNEQICALVDAANAYAASEANYYSGACLVYTPTTGNGYYDRWMQYLVVSGWNPLSSLTVSKEQSYDAATGSWTELPKQVTWRLASTDGTTDGAVYDRTITSAEGSATVTFEDTPKETRYRLFELQAPDGFKPRETIGLYCNPDGSWSVWNAQTGSWDAATWATEQDGSTVYTGISQGVLHVQDAPTAGAIELFKVSAEPLVTDGNACYTLDGALYGVYADEGLTQLVDTLRTDEVGHAVSGALDEGAYWVHETAPSKGYALDEAVYRVEVKSGRTSRVNEQNGGQVLEEPQGDPQAMVVRKVDAQTGTNVAQGDMTLEGAEITVCYYKGSYTEDDLRSDDAPAPERTWILKTDEDGVSLLLESYKVGGDELYKLGGRPYLPLGTVTVQETKAPQGYELDPMVYVCHFTPDESGRKWISFDMTATIPQAQVMGGVGIRKVDAEDGTASPRGAASLDGATFAIYNASEHDVTVEGTVYEPQTLEDVQAGTAQAIMTIEAHDGAATTDTDGDGVDASLPFGTYYLREVASGAGYLLDDTVRTVEVREAGAVAWCEDTYANQVIRGDIAFDKVYEDTKATMPGVAFLVESTTTHERHVVVTDAIGHVDTSAAVRSHTHRTNANDAAWDAATGTVDETLLDADAGLWFYGNIEGTGEPNDALGALPYDTYTFTELATTASQGTELVSFEVSIRDDKTTVDLGTVEDTWIPTLTTQLLSRDGSQAAYALGDERLVDTGSYGHFKAGTYVAELELCDEAGNVLQDAAGNVLRTSAELELAGDGTYQIGIDCDLSGFAGQRIVARQRVYDARGELYASHDDMTSEAQSVWVIDKPSIATTLTDVATGLHMANAAQAITLTDTVVYTNLKPGKTYTLTGTLMDKESASQVLDAAGKPVSASVEFTPQAASGTQAVEFTFDASGLAGKTIVAFETLTCEGRELAVHADIADEAQAVDVPRVGTTLATADGAHSVMGTSPIDLVDTVAYENVTVGKTYRVVGTLHDAKSGEAYQDAAGKPLEACMEFTADKSGGSVDVTFKGVSGIQAGQAVAFEELYVKAGDGEGDDAWKLVASHCDLADANQTVSFNTPNLRTTLTEKETGLHETAFADKVTLVDIVEYDGLEAGKTYHLEGKLVDKQTGKVLKDGKGKQLTASGDFTASAAKGRVNVTFAFDASLLAGKEVVAFESVSFSGREVAVHANIDDAAQTVSFVDIRTTAQDPADGDHEAVALANMQLVDRVEMRGLIPGASYTIVTELAVADTHETVIASSTSFVPTKSATTLDVTATFDGSGLAGKKLVFLEKLQRDGKTIAQHRDYDDAGQTVALVTPPPVPTTPGVDLPQTGQGLMWACLVGVGGICMLAGLVLVLKKRGNGQDGVPRIAYADVSHGARAACSDEAQTGDQPAQQVPRIRPKSTSRASLRTRRHV